LRSRAEHVNRCAVNSNFAQGENIDTIALGQVVSIDVLAYDLPQSASPPATWLTLGVSNPSASSGTATVVGNQIQYNPGSTVGLVTITYDADNTSCAGGMSDSATVTLSVAAPDTSGPTADADAASVTEGGSVVIDVLDGDADNASADPAPNISPSSAWQKR
jgi:hypothetical protein